MNATATKLLDAAQGMVQERGYNAFSYRDLASVVGIRTASIHYHFESKAVLAQALMERYRQGLTAALATIDAKGSNQKAKLKAFIGLYKETEHRGAICLCGSMASDFETLPDAVRDQVKAYLDASEQWVQGALRAGVREGEFQIPGKPQDVAASLLAGLQGGLILSRARSGTAVLAQVQRAFFASL